MMAKTCLRRTGFTLAELLVALGILAILAGILAPSILYTREMGRRTRCSENLRKLGMALSQYGHANRDELPRVIYDQKNKPHGYMAFSGADASDPFTSGTNVLPNDVTASLWLLVRGGYISSEYSPVTAVFICPSSGNVADALQDGTGRPVGPRERSNFRGRQNLSYSYASPFGDAPGYGLKTDFIPKDFVLLADKNPGRGATKPEATDGPLEMAVANSHNHRQAGQNVLYGDVHVEFRDTPYCGVDGDNIYSVQAEGLVISGERPTPSARGQVGRQYSPAWQTDSYLVPTDGD